MSFLVKKGKLYKLSDLPYLARALKEVCTPYGQLWQGRLKKSYLVSFNQKMFLKSFRENSDKKNTTQRNRGNKLRLMQPLLLQILQVGV